MKLAVHKFALALLVAAAWTSAARAQHGGRPGAHITPAASLDISLYAEILRAADARDPDSALFARGVSARDIRIRRAAVRAASQLALSRRAFALSVARRLVSDPDSSIASSAVFGLGLGKDTASIEVLAAAVRRQSPASPIAAWALGEIGKPAARTLASLLAEPASHKSTARVRALLIAESKIRPLDIAAVKPYLASRNAELRWAAAYAVARGRNVAGARALLDARSGDAAFEAEVARELTASIVGDSLRGRALPHLRKLELHADPHVRLAAVRSVASYGVEARADILQAMHDRDANVRVTAAQSAALAFARDTTSWADAWAVDTGYMFRVSLLASAAAARFALSGATVWSHSPDWRLRAAVINAFAGAHDTVGLRAAAVSGANDSDGRVRAAAYGALSSIDSTRPDTAVKTLLLRALSDPDTLAQQASSRYKPPRDIAVPPPRPIEWYADVVRSVVLPSMAGHSPIAVLHTVRGDITLRLYGAETPLTVANFAALIGRRYYDGARFHRVVPGFVAQDGDPRGDGNGGPGYSIRDELTAMPYSRGAVGMALSGPDTGGSQYFLTLTPQPHLDGHYTVFATVVSGLSVMDSLVQGDAIISITMKP